MDFYAITLSRSTIKIPNVIHICRLYSYRDVNEKQALVDTNYPRKGGSAVYKKYILLCISAYIGHIWLVVDNKKVYRGFHYKGHVEKKIKS